MVGVLALVNGGYAYRITCPLPGGGSESSWTYSVSGVFPYARSTPPPCHRHAGARVALDAAGVWEHPNHEQEDVERRNEQAARTLAAATQAITRELAIEAAVVKQFEHRLRPGYRLTATERWAVRQAALSSEERLRSIRARLDRTPQPPDRRLRQTKRLLSNWLRYQAAARRLFGVTRSNDELRRRAVEVASAIGHVTHDLRPLSDEVEARYPQDWAWGFLRRAS